MIDELTIYNLVAKYPTTVDLIREVEKMVRAEAIDECKEVVRNILKYYADEYHFGVTFNLMVGTILDRVEQLKEKKNE